MTDPQPEAQPVNVRDLLNTMVKDITELLDKHTKDPNLATAALLLVAAQIAVIHGHERLDYKVVRQFRIQLDDLRKYDKLQKQRAKSISGTAVQ